MHSNEHSITSIGRVLFYIKRAQDFKTREYEEVTFDLTDEPVHQLQQNQRFQKRV